MHRTLSLLPSLFPNHPFYCSIHSLVVLSTSCVPLPIFLWMALLQRNYGTFYWIAPSLRLFGSRPFTPSASTSLHRQACNLHIAYASFKSGRKSIRHFLVCTSLHQSLCCVFFSLSSPPFVAFLRTLSTTHMDWTRTCICIFSSPHVH